MKSQVTQKQIRNGSAYVLRVGYCDIQHLLTYDSPFAYNAGVYGWNCDYYSTFHYDGCDGVICTGYRPHGKSVPYEIIRKYELQARKINDDRNIPYDDRVTAIRKLLADFIKEAKAA